MPSPFLLREILAGVIKVYGSEMDVPICPAHSSNFLLLRAEAVSFTLLLFQLGSWSLIPFSVAERRKKGHRRHCPNHKNRLVACERQWDSSGTIKTRPYCHIAKKRCQREGPPELDAVVLPPSDPNCGASILTRSKGGWGMSTVKRVWKSGAVCCVGP